MFLAANDRFAPPHKRRNPADTPEASIDPRIPAEETPAASPPPRTRSRLRWVAVLCAVALAAAGFAVFAVESRTPTRSATGPGAPVPVDRALPRFALPTLAGGRRVDSASLRGEVLLLNFWGSWCAPCRAESNTLRALSRQLRGDGVHVVGVDVLDLRGSALGFVRSHRLGYLELFDPQDRLQSELGLAAYTPASLLVDRSGVIRYVLFGPAQAAPVRADLLRLAGH